MSILRFRYFCISYTDNQAGLKSLTLRAKTPDAGQLLSIRYNVQKLWKGIVLLVISGSVNATKLIRKTRFSETLYAMEIILGC